MSTEGALASSSEPDGTGGVLLVDKPAGMTSFAVVRRVRRLLGIKKVGHAGTLDPFATGLLVVCVGRPATRCVELFMGGRKTYLARLQLGVETETQDPEGTVVRTAQVPELDEPAIASCLLTHAGPQLQAPPPYSAAKFKGKPLYAYARKGVFIEKEAKPIEIYALRSTGYDPVSSQLDIQVSCSRGTYVRVLAADIGRTFGCGAHLIGLRRTAIGGLTVESSLDGSLLLQEDFSPILQGSMRGVEETVRAMESLTL